MRGWTRGQWGSVLHDARHGPLPVLILVLTFLAGLVDATSFMGPGRVFVGNMTGNIIVLGLSLGNSARFSLPASMAAIAAFLAGAVASGWLRDGFGANRGLLLAVTAAAEFVLVAVTLVLALGLSDHDWQRSFAFIVLLAVAMGAQNATAVRMGVSGLSTTVLTTTLSGLAAGSPIGGGGCGPAELERRAAAVVAMLLGAGMGALLLLHTGVVAVLVLGLALLALTAVAAYVAARAAPPWTAPP